ncbi:Gfo/Idh/MocA family protein [Aliarcobacter cryaerophilus]|uniref:3-chlorobenzoate-3,4-dioxygenase n=1 Tax=Aliarcobacter cryaerophilus TaxID=28198 RepID=A0A2S9TBI9_9BACT|nr:Gfo/Idh/MocA family oxidoreductase [Aliarcobacter cryaerophilus]PRM96149.1 3-chlorobenzoate-3,4-dioxygenase [Arcobacter cryaerophilus gv. crypticus]
MRFLVIGLGSMGKRRVRNLIALGHKDNIAGFDLREDRRIEAKKYEIDIFDDFEKAMNEFKPNAFLISTPPNLHMHYAYIAEQNDIHCFIEASVVDAEKILELSNRIKNKKILMAPSCTMRYYPMPTKIKELINNRIIGKVLNYNYQTGQYLTDWHPWEKIEDFYVSNPDTGGCREIVPFELTWLNDIFGNSKPLACVRKKLTNINADIDDIYHCILEYPNNIIGNLTVEVVSRPKATREIRILGTEGEIVYSADNNELKYINLQMNDWERINFDIGTVESGYINPEEPYINEVKAYIDAIEKVLNGENSTYPNTLEDDYKILQTLYKLEEISEGRHDLSR